MIKITGSERHELLPAITYEVRRSNGKHVKQVEVTYVQQFLCKPAIENNDSITLKTMFEENDIKCLRKKAVQRGLNVQIDIV